MVSPTNLRENQRQSKIEISNEGPPGKASSTRMALAVEWRLVHVGNPRHAALLTQGTVSGPRHLFGGNAAQPAREHHLRLVVKVAAQRVGPDAGSPQQLRRAQRVTSHHNIAGAT